MEADLIDTMFQKFESQFGPTLQTFLQNQQMHHTNKDALRCFIISMLINIFQSPKASKNDLLSGYISASPDCIFFLAAFEDPTRQARFLDMFVFNLAVGEGGRKPILTRRSRDTLVAMLIADKLVSLLPKKKLPMAKIVNLEPASNMYKVSVVFSNVFTLDVFGFL